MSGLSIPQPGVEVEQDFVAETASPATPAQQEVIVGPCFQVVSALDDNGLPLPEALAGAYRDGFGVIAYPLPGLSPGALVTGFLEDIRVFLSLGSMRRELHSVYDEVSIFSGSDSKIAGTPWSACVLTDPGVNFVTEGVAEGDVVRVTYQGEVRDVLVSSVAATQLGLDEDSLTRAFGTPTSGSVDIDFATYSVIRNPAEFAYVEAASVARYTLGSDSDYVVFRVKTTAPTAYLGDGGDGLQIALAAQPYTLRDTSCFVGANIFWDTSAGQNFVATVGAIGAVTSRYLLIGAVGASAALLDVLRVVSNQILVIENGATANQTAQNYVVAISVDSGGERSHGRWGRDGLHQRRSELQHEHPEHGRHARHGDPPGDLRRGRVHSRRGRQRHGAHHLRRRGRGPGRPDLHGRAAARYRHGHRPDRQGQHRRPDHGLLRRRRPDDGHPERPRHHHADRR
jgi:hypothetical protein